MIRTTQSCGNSTVSKGAFTPVGFSTSTRFISQPSWTLITGNIQIYCEILFSARPTKYSIKQQHAVTLKECNISTIIEEILDTLITRKAIALNINVWSEIKKEKTWHKRENAINSRFSRGKLHNRTSFSLIKEKKRWCWVFTKRLKIKKKIGSLKTQLLGY